LLFLFLRWWKCPYNFKCEMQWHNLPHWTSVRHGHLEWFVYQLSSDLLKNSFLCSWKTSYVFEGSHAANPLVPVRLISRFGAFSTPSARNPLQFWQLNLYQWGVFKGGTLIFFCFQVNAMSNLQGQTNYTSLFTLIFSICFV
jgi:hypothetical protein